MEQPKTPLVCAKIQTPGFNAGSVSRRAPLTEDIRVPLCDIIAIIQRKERQEREGERPRVYDYVPENRTDDSSESDASNSAWRPPVEKPPERGVWKISMF
jgi:hypothetical protein